MKVRIVNDIIIIDLIILFIFVVTYLLVDIEIQTKNILPDLCMHITDIVL